MLTTASAGIDTWESYSLILRIQRDNQVTS